MDPDAVKCSWQVSWRSSLCGDFEVRKMGVER